MKNQLIALFNGAKPSVCKYNLFLKEMPLAERGIFRNRTFGLAMTEWNGLSVAYRLFLVRLITSERQLFVDYVRQETVLGALLLDLEDRDLLLKVLNLWMYPFKNHKTSYTDLAFSLLLVWNVDLSVKYLADKIRCVRMDSYDFAELLEKRSDVVLD
ncbi:MAG: hypothetical protein Q4A54_03570 [Parabacteroides sp.]|nr:hypothetical protein [Parabacteroides sp.]